MAIINETGGLNGNAIFAIDADGASAIELPDGFKLANAEYAREGSDLVVKAADGQEVLVTDYFASGSPAELVSSGGAHLSGTAVTHLAGPMAPGEFAQAAPAMTAEPIGTVDNIDGGVTARRADGTEVELEVGDPVFQGDVLSSGADGAIGVVLADGTSFSMAENGQMVLDEMVYDPGAQDGSVGISVVQGVFTFVSGEIAKTDPDAMTITTPWPPSAFAAPRWVSSTSRARRWKSS